VSVPFGCQGLAAMQVQLLLEIRTRSATNWRDALKYVIPVHRSSVASHFCFSVMKPASRCAHVTCMCVEAHVTGGDVVTPRGFVTS
jgi:hypothetical protein